MTMPKWHEMMRPVLSALAGADVLTSDDLSRAVIDEFHLTQEEQSERLKSGQLRYHNRMYWAITDLHKAGFLDYAEGRGKYRITAAGRSFLGRHDSPFTTKDLMAESIPFREWKMGYRAAEREEKRQRGGDPSDEADTSSPQETMQSAYSEMRDALADELLQTVMQQSPWFFEYLVGKLLEAMGYGDSFEESVQVTRKSNDEGIDGIVKEDKLGFDKVYYQAKRWGADHVVGRPEIQSFAGALAGKGATKGLYITTSRFSSSAVGYAEGLSNQKIVLVDGKGLADLMIDYGVGVSTVQTFEVKAVDEDFFTGE
jgi:restriction system protein